MRVELNTYNPGKCAQTRRNALRKEVKEHGLGEVISTQTYMYKDSVLVFTYKIGGIIW